MIVRHRAATGWLWLDLDAPGGVTVTLDHGRLSRHHGTIVIPVVEIVDVQYGERSGLTPPWGRIVTVTGSHPDRPADDPCSWQGGDPPAAFAHLVMLLARLHQREVEAHATSEVIAEELRTMRGLIDKWRDQPE